MKLQTACVLMLFCLGCGDGLDDSASGETDERAPIRTSATNDATDPDTALGDKDDEEVATAKDPGEDVGDDVDERTPRETCILSEEYLPDRFTIQSVTHILNELPKPVTIPCLLDVLPKPMRINATSSELSVQPAVGTANPRVFISLNSLIITFALDGKGSEALEFSEYVGGNLSVKGEIGFPVTEELADDAAFARIRQVSGNGTTCAGCHFEEERADDRFPEAAYVSLALRPFDRQDVSIEQLQSQVDQCGDVVTKRCELLRSMFGETTAEPYSFPQSFPTLF